MSYQLFLIPILAGILSQIIKLATDKVQNNFKWRNFVSDYGRMPSSHAAFISALVAEMALFAGIKSPSFAIALVLAILVIKDATGLRWHISQQGKVLNKISQQLEFKEVRLEERLEHKFSEILVGCLIGIGLALLFYYLL